MTKWKAIAVLMLALLPSLGRAQDHDAQARLGFELKQNLPKGFDLQLGYQYRRDHGLMALQGSYFTADLAYKLADHWHALGEFRYATSYEWDKFRFGLGLQYHDKVGKWQLSAKLRLQREFFLQSIPANEQFPLRTNIRLKLQAEHKVIKHVRGHISTEPQVRFEGIEGRFQRIRNIAGIDIELAKRHSLDLSYYFQPEWRGSIDAYSHMAVVTYSWDLGKWWKKKKDEEKSE